MGRPQCQQDPPSDCHGLSQGIPTTSSACPPLLHRGCQSVCRRLKTSADGEDWWGGGGAGGEEGLPRTCVLTEERPKEHAEMLEAAFKRSEKSLQAQKCDRPSGFEKKLRHQVAIF